MPARIVVVHNDPAFGECALAAMEAAGHEFQVFPAAWKRSTPSSLSSTLSFLSPETNSRKADRMALRSHTRRA